jgi:hypothetical protein
MTTKSFARPLVEQSSDPLVGDGLPLADLGVPPEVFARPSDLDEQGTMDDAQARPLTLNFLLTPEEDPEFWEVATDAAYDVTFTKKAVVYVYNNYITQYNTWPVDDH